MNRRLSILMPRIAVVCPRWAQAPRGTVVLVAAWLASVAAFARTTNPRMDSRNVTVIAAGPLSTLVLPDHGVRGPWVDQLGNRPIPLLAPTGTATTADLIARLDAVRGHGTHVAGIVAQTAPKAKILPVRGLDGNARGTLRTVFQGLVHAVDPDADLQTDEARVPDLPLGTAGPEALARPRATAAALRRATRWRRTRTAPSGDRRPGFREQLPLSPAT